MASLHDVALLAGVSKSTVSRVINDEYGVKEATKVKVRKAIDECGYLPNQVAKDLKSQKTNLVGVIVPRVASNASGQGIDGLSHVFETCGKHVLLANSQLDYRKEIDFIQLFNQKRVEGIILYATHIDAQLVDAIKLSRVPVVLVGQDGSLFGVPSVIHDDVRVGFRAALRLVQAGAKNIGFIGVTSQDIAVDQLRYQGLSQGMQHAGLGEPLFHSRGEFAIDSGKQQVLELIKQYPDLDGLFCATDRIAIGAIQGLSEAGKHVGKEVKVLGVGDDELACVVSPQLSTFNYPFDKAGEMAAKVLLELIEGKPQIMSKHVLSFTEVDRQTCKSS
ncbi:LacI family DNA-binding transcriptional regulator [Vibrio sp. SCSIO 43136]|uniref:LacI family DNA-binding transcriptional regulator n=1 Tax=Vibrio sp. SCSIO 43136 TaxID=2819101 RepID=UPI0020756EDA|nr:LacI family DNA-binding transcriptional regulator [Vibrio sp. SCSIO 43136]USD67944.1 LacI family DNA-binding transcriptional regulator [Vibrio sp. SCSIO 43136]